MRSTDFGMDTNTSHAGQAETDRAGIAPMGGYKDHDCGPSRASFVATTHRAKKLIQELVDTYHRLESMGRCVGYESGEVEQLDRMLRHLRQHADASLALIG